MKTPVAGTVYGGRYTVTLIPGDGIGHEMANSVKTVFKAASVPVEWEEFDVSGLKVADPALLKQTMDSIRRNKVALKGMYNLLCHFNQFLSYCIK